VKRASALLAALLVAGGFAALALRGSRARANGTEAAGPSAEPAAPNRGGAPDGEEVRRLRADLQTKDRIIRELVAQGAAKDADHAAMAASAAAHRPTDREAALEHARQVLDERLAAPGGAGSPLELDRALTTALDPSALGATRVTSRRCNGTMCRVTIAADSAATMNASLEATMERLPKVFAGTAVYDADEGTRALYVARTNEDLAIDAP
jgi:hypothetical protein